MDTDVQQSRQSSGMSAGGTVWSEEQSTVATGREDGHSCGMEGGVARSAESHGSRGHSVREGRFLGTPSCSGWQEGGFSME